MNPHQDLIKALFQVVWADDVVSPDEARALALVLRHLGMSAPEIICTLDRNLSRRPDPEDPVRLDELFSDRRHQMEALQALMTVCFSGGEIKPEQVGYIEGLVVRMGLSAQELETLRTRAIEANRAC